MNRVYSGNWGVSLNSVLLFGRQEDGDLVLVVGSVPETIVLPWNADTARILKALQDNAYNLELDEGEER